MDLTPPYHRSAPQSGTKSASRLARPLHFESEDSLRLSLDLVPSSPKNKDTPSPSPKPFLPLHELLLLSPPIRRSRTRLAERLEMAEEPIEPIGSRRKCKNRAGSIASPRNVRRSRRRIEVDTREETEVGVAEEVGKVKKKKKGRSKKDRLSLVVPSAPSPTINDGDGCNLDEIGQFITDLVMWEDVSKSTLWFGFGSICFLSSCFASGINFSMFSMMSQLGLLLLGLSFFSKSICQRGDVETKRTMKVTEEDILRVARVILPALNFVISKTRELFSGEPTMTLKVALFLVIGSEYGHLMTLWRLCALGFFISFTGPKLYSSYSTRINNIVEGLKKWASEAWGGCSHKKIVAASAATAFWNLTAFRTRIFAAFIFVVVLRYYKQHSAPTTEEEEEHEQQQALVVVDRAAEK